MGPIPDPTPVIGCLLGACLLAAASTVAMGVFWLCGVEPGWWMAYAAGVILAGVLGVVGGSLFSGQ